MRVIEDFAAQLKSLPSGYRAMVFGASGGLGSAFARALIADDRCALVYAGSRREGVVESDKLRPFRFDLEDEASIATAVHHGTLGGPVHLVIVATGILHAPSIQPEKTWTALTSDSFERAFAINTIGPALIAKHLLSHLATGGKSVFAALSARVGSIGDNRLRGWHAYRASKAALNMVLRTISIELHMRNKTAICVGLHPGTVHTALSKPFTGGSRPMTVFSPEVSVEHLLHVIDELTPPQSGRVWAWDGSEIPF